MVRPFPFLATLLTAISLVFFIVAASTSSWLINYQANIQVYEGVYNSCWRQHDIGIDGHITSTSPPAHPTSAPFSQPPLRLSLLCVSECRHVNNDCTADFSMPIDTFSVTDYCSSWRAVRAFLVLAIITTALALLALYLSSFMKLPYLPLRPYALSLSFLAGLFGLIAWAVFISISTSNTASTPTTSITDWLYGFSFALLTSAWVLNWLSLLFAALPFPYLPSAYDRTRYLPEASPEQREQERRAALREGGFGAGLWGLLGVSEEKRRGYSEKWRGGWEGEKGKGGGGGGRREEGQRETGEGGTTGGGGIFGGQSGQSHSYPPGFIEQKRATGGAPSETRKEEESAAGPVHVRHTEGSGGGGGGSGVGSRV